MTFPFSLLAQLHRTDVKLPGDNTLTQATVDRVRGVVMILFGSLALVIMAYAGFKYITSQGNPQETAKAQNAIIYGLGGLVIAIFATTLILFVINRIW